MLTNHVVSEKTYLPHEPGEWVELRLLSHKDLAAAREAAQQAQYDQLQKMGKEVYSLITGGEARLSPEEQAARRALNPLQSYDLDDLLTRGIVDWSYKLPDGSGAPVNPENLAGLDEKTANFLARVLIGVEESEKNALNGSAGSTELSTEPTPSTADSSPTSGGWDDSVTRG